MGDILDWLLGIPAGTLYLVLGVAAAIENIVPPIPADVMVVAGAVVTGLGDASPRALFLAVWTGNVCSALLVYAVGRRFGPAFFEGRIGRLLLAPRQLNALTRAYHRHGFPIIFVSRFLPVFRPVVPAFAGVSHLGFWGTAIPIAIASAVWYGFLVYLGATAGENWEAVVGGIRRMGVWLTALAVILLALGGRWWWRTRRPDGTLAK